MEGTENEYSDEEVALSTKYLYYVEAYDKTGNYSSSEEAVIVTGDVDRQAPKVTLGNFEPIEGREMEFFPETEWDNVEIVKYIWDFGMVKPLQTKIQNIHIENPGNIQLP